MSDNNDDLTMPITLVEPRFFAELTDSYAEFDAGNLLGSLSMVWLKSATQAHFERLGSVLQVISEEQKSTRAYLSGVLVPILSELRDRSGPLSPINNMDLSVIEASVKELDSKELALETSIQGLSNTITTVKDSLIVEVNLVKSNLEKSMQRGFNDVADLTIRLNSDEKDLVELMTHKVELDAATRNLSSMDAQVKTHFSDLNHALGVLKQLVTTTKQLESKFEKLDSDVVVPVVLLSDRSSQTAAGVTVEWKSAAYTLPADAPSGGKVILPPSVQLTNLAKNTLGVLGSSAVQKLPSNAQINSFYLTWVSLVPTLIMGMSSADASRVIIDDLNLGNFIHRDLYAIFAAGAVEHFKLPSETLITDQLVLDFLFHMKSSHKDGNLESQAALDKDMHLIVYDKNYASINIGLLQLRQNIERVLENHELKELFLARGSANKARLVILCGYIMYHMPESVKQQWKSACMSQVHLKTDYEQLYISLREWLADERKASQLMQLSSKGEKSDKTSDKPKVFTKAGDKGPPSGFSPSKAAGKSPAFVAAVAALKGDEAKIYAMGWTSLTSAQQEVRKAIDARLKKL